jgi:hypothetical protein
MTYILCLTWKWAIAWDLREMGSVWGKGARVGQAPYNTSIKVLILISVISFRIINHKALKKTKALILCQLLVNITLQTHTFI